MPDRRPDRPQQYRGQPPPARRPAHVQPRNQAVRPQRRRQLSWPEALQKFIFSPRYLMLKFLLTAMTFFGTVVPIEEVLEFVPVVNGAEDTSMLAVVIRLFVVVHRIKKQGKPV